MANICGIIHEFREQSPKWIEKGLASCDRALELDPNFAEVAAARARVFYAEKKYDQAIRYAQLAIERKSECEYAYNTLGRAYVRARILMATELAQAGEVEETERHLQMARALRPNTNVLYNAACACGIMEKKQQAFDTSRKAIEFGYGNFEWIKQDPHLLFLRDDSEFQKLVSRKQMA